MIDELQAIVDMIPDFGGGTAIRDTSGYALMSTDELFDLGIADLTDAKDTLLQDMSNIMEARDLAQSGVDLLSRAVQKALSTLRFGQDLAPLDSCVVFISDPEEDPGFDVYLYPGSEHQYTIRHTIDKQDYYVAHKAIIPNTSNGVKVVLPEKKYRKTLYLKPMQEALSTILIPAPLMKTDIPSSS